MIARRPQLDLRVDHAGRPNELLRDDLRAGELERPGSRGDEDELLDLPQELVEAERPVIERRRQAEAVVDEGLLTRAVTLVHAAELGDGLVRLVDEDDEVLSEVVDEREGMRAGRPAFEHPRVVLDAVAEAELLQHLEVVLRALTDAVRLEHPPLALERRDLLLELEAELVDRPLDRRTRRDVLGRRPDREVVHLRVDLAGQRVEVRDLLDLVTEERHAIGGLAVRRLDLHHIALDTEAPAPENGVVADVLAVDQLPQHLVAVVLLSHLQNEQPLAPLLWRADAVDAGDRGDDDDIAAGEKRRSRGEPEAGDVVVLGRVLLDVEIGLRDVGLGLVVVVVGDEVLDRVLREELAELVAELCGERLVVCDDERGLLDLLDDPGHRRRLPGAGRSEDGLEAVAVGDRRRDLGDRARLVAGRRIDVRRAEFAHRG